jgi:diadenosine tetraphosphate (Ap4A) HIT family hydrolase
MRLKGALQPLHSLASQLSHRGERPASSRPNRGFDVFVSHATADDSKDVYNQLNAFLTAKGKVVFNPTTHLAHVKQINKEAMQDAVRGSRLVVAALSEAFFKSSWCEAEVQAAMEAGIKVIPAFSGDDHGSKQIDRWVAKYKTHAVFGYVFRENARDVLNKQSPTQVKHTLDYLATLCSY